MKELGKITKPHHYVSGNIETINVIEAWVGGLTPESAFRIGNAIKYLSRWNKKNGTNDLLKVLWYVSRELKLQGRANDAVETVLASVRLPVEQREVDIEAWIRDGD